MVASAKEGRDDLHTHEAGLNLVRVAGIYGANAAGKSNVLSALEFMRGAILQSHRFWGPNSSTPVEPFLLRPKEENTPSLFETDFITDGKRYQYGFKINPTEITEEWLYSYPRGRRLTLFKRKSGAKEEFVFGRELKGNNKTIERLTRKNSLFLSAATANNHETLSKVYAWFSGKLSIARSPINDVFGAIRLVNQFEKNAVVRLLALADLGIVDLQVTEEPLPELSREMMAVALRNSDPEALSRAGFKLDDQSMPRVEFKHSSGSHSAFLPLEIESKGTQAWFFLSGLLLKALNDGSILCVDEINSSLHPRLGLEIINIFQSPTRNPNGAQLIFNTHDTNFLGNLSRDQVWFVEKSNEGATTLYPLTDFKPRKFENLERGYLQGRYGAIPFVYPTAAEKDA